MESIRKWLYKPKRDDKSLLAQFFYADEHLNLVANVLDSFDGRQDPERCTALVNQLRQTQDKVLTITNLIMEELIGDERANRDFRVKFPEDVLQDNLAGQLWFGAECLAAGSSIMNKEWESFTMRPLARAVTKTLENVRNLLRDACLKNNIPNGPIKLDTNDLFTEMLLESLKIFDKLFAQFEFHYVSAMVPVKSTQEYELQQLIGVLFSETLHRALNMKLLTQEMIDDCDPALMLTIPRLAIVSGLLVFPDGPLCIDENVEKMSEMFRPFRTLLHKIRELLWILDKREIYMLEKLLCDNEQLDDVKSVSDVNLDFNKDENLERFYGNFPFGHRSVSSALPNRSCENANDDSDDDDDVDVQKTGQVVADNDLPSLDEPSTSYFIPKNVVRNTIIASSISPSRRSHSASVSSSSGPQTDSLEVISAAAASLSSILNTENQTASSSTTSPSNNKPINDHDVESQSDSGICTETTSLDRSPSFDMNDARNCHCAVKVASHHHHNRRCQNRIIQHTNQRANQKGNDIKIQKKNLTSRKKTHADAVCAVVTSSSSSSSAASSFASSCTTYEEDVFGLQASLQNTGKDDLRARYRSSEDLIHRLFVCIAGVADQLQTNFACDLRNILKSVFLMNACESSAPLPTKSVEPPSPLEASIEYHPNEDEVENNEFSVDPNILAQEALFDTNVYFHLESGTCPTTVTDFNNHYQIDERNDSSDAISRRYASLQEDMSNLHVTPHNETRAPVDAHERRQQHRHHHHHGNDKPPIWIPDVQAPKCMSCSMNFNVMKRRHHCRNCGKVFCGKCSANSMPLPKYGIYKAVRVCNRCFLYNLSSLTTAIH